MRDVHPFSAEGPGLDPAAEASREICTQCGKGVRDMRKHLETHTWKLKHSCQHCPAAFTTIEALANHQRRNHGEDKADIADNEEQQEEAKKFPCNSPGCHKRFARKQQLQRHKIKAHSAKLESDAVSPAPKRRKSGFKQKPDLRASLVGALPGITLEPVE